MKATEQQILEGGQAKAGPGGFNVVPLTPHVGAAIVGLDLRDEIDAATAEALKQAFKDHHLLVVRQENLPDEAQVRFASVFGTVGIRYSRGNENANSVTQFVSNSRSDGILGDGEITFHMDHTFYETPLKAIALYGITIPASGTKTKFRNAHALYERLPEDLKRRAEGVRIFHFFNYSGDHTQWQDPANAPADSPSAWQPLVWENPETGQRALWLSPLSTNGFEGISDVDGTKLIGELWDYAASIDEGLTYVHPWATGDLVIWDNRMLHHARTPFDSDEPRTLRRNAVL